MNLDRTGGIKTQMLIRRPAAQVFAAFVDPALTTRFWFTKSSGRLEPGAEVQWDWEMYGVSTCVRVHEMEENRRILILWDEPPTPVEWLFEEQPDNTTLVDIAAWGFNGGGEEAAGQAVDAMGGFTMVLAGLKALLEYGVELNLVADAYPDAHVQRR